MQPKLTVVSGSLPEPPYPEGILARGWTFELDVERVFQSDTWNLAPEEVRPWLLMIWLTSWKNFPVGAYTANDDAIAARIGMPRSMFRLHRDTLMRGWELHSDGRLYHPVLTKLVLKMINKRSYDRVAMAKYRSIKNQEHTPNVNIDSKILAANHAATTPTPTPQKQLKKKTSPIASAEFENFWTAYGKKVGRQAALREWAKLDPKDDLLAKILQASISQAKATEQKFRKDPERWLRDRRWEDQRQQALMPPGQAPPRNWAKSQGV